jgi:hypothetical protein
MTIHRLCPRIAWESSANLDYFILFKAACLQMSENISINQTSEKCTKILGKRKRFNIQEIIYKL